MNPSQLRIGIDTGGTFTDIVAVDTASGRMHVTKVSSTPANPALGLVKGVHEILDKCGAGVGNVISLSHGTTVATNALLQDRIESLGLIVSEGFRHILEIARQSVPDGYGNSYFWVKPERIVPLELVQEVRGRLNFRGEELQHLDESSVRSAARFFKAKGVRSVGVCLLHSYANAAHERRVSAILQEEYPELVVSLSCAVLPEYREYERAMTTLVDAFIKPRMVTYLKNIKEELGATLGRKPFLVMQSSGGVMSSGQVVDKPISTALSGPAAGALGAAVIARLAGFPDTVTLDAGGTSTDICLVESGEPHITNGSSIGPFPVRVPMIDVQTIGTGGGSIAWISREGHLKVGPKSAGAAPGPMCYPNGGSEPTITDANLVLGRLPPFLIGGAIKLDAQRARAGIAELSRKLGSRMSAEQLAEGIIEIANWNQANCIRQVTIQQGIDPRQFALLSFGGSGPAQSAAVVRLLEMRCCLVPPNPGNVSAFGLLAVDWRTDHVATRVTHEDAIDAATLATIYRKLEQEAMNTLQRDGLNPTQCRTLREADVRYLGQSMEVRVHAPAGPIDTTFVHKLLANFHAAHRRAFGYDYEGQQKVELVNFRVSGLGLIERPQLPKRELNQGDTPSKKDVRRVFFSGEYLDTAIYERESLPPGFRIGGPAVVEEFGSTTVVFPGQCLEVDPHGIMLIRENAPGKDDRR